VNRLGQIGREGLADARLTLVVPAPRLGHFGPRLRTEPNRDRHTSALQLSQHVLPWDR
jgi:hypothetical protein